MMKLIRGRSGIRESGSLKECKEILVMSDGIQGGKSGGEFLCEGKTLPYICVAIYPSTQIMMKILIKNAAVNYTRADTCRILTEIYVSKFCLPFSVQISVFMVAFLPKFLQTSHVLISETFMALLRVCILYLVWVLSHIGKIKKK